MRLKNSELKPGPYTMHWAGTATAVQVISFAGRLQAIPPSQYPIELETVPDAEWEPLDKTSGVAPESTRMVGRVYSKGEDGFVASLEVLHLPSLALLKYEQQKGFPTRDAATLALAKMLAQQCLAPIETKPADAFDSCERCASPNYETLPMYGRRQETRRCLECQHTWSVPL